MEGSVFERDEIMRIMFVGDVYMKKGRESFDRFFTEAKKLHRPHLVIVNGENIADGNGLTTTIYKQYMKKGVHGFTMGNHAFSKRHESSALDEPNVCRPANYGGDVRGNRFIELRLNDETLLVVNLLGRIFMGDPVENPFTTIDRMLEETDADHVLVDFHAEATSEKYAMANYLDGRVDALIGTHTHVPTADETVFPKGLLYITDVGMTGISHSIIGGKIEQGIRKFLTGVPERIHPETKGPLQFNAVLLDLEQHTIERINYHE
jgi:hypothetical protein